MTVMKCIECSKEIEVTLPGYADNIICKECYEKDPSYVVYGRVDKNGNIEKAEHGENNG